MATEYLSCIETIVPHNTKPEASIIWLHGLGADGHDFEPIIPALDIPKNLSVRFLFPHAPQRPVTINNGVIMRAWYDIKDIQIDRKVDTENVRESSDQLIALIEREIERGISSERILLAGFSQGGAIVLHTGLRYPKTLAGIIALSTYLITKDTIDKERHTANQNISILMGHGTSDPVVPLSLGKKARDILQSLNYSVRWLEYFMGHEVCLQEINDVRKMILDCLE